MMPKHEASSEFEFFTPNEVAQRLKVSRRQVNRWIASGELIAHKFNRMRRISRASLDEFLRQHREP